MNRYLSRDDRSTWLSMGAFLNYLQNLDENYSKGKCDRTILKYVRTMRTLADKTIRLRMEYLDPNEILKLAKEATRVKIISTTNYEAMKDYEAAAKLDSNTVIDTQDWLDIAEHCIEGACKVCQSDPEVCRVKQLFLKYDIEPLNPTAPVGVCPYKY